MMPDNPVRNPPLCFYKGAFAFDNMPRMNKFLYLFGVILLDTLQYLFHVISEAHTEIILLFKNRQPCMYNAHSYE